LNLASLADVHPAGRPALYGPDGWLDWRQVRSRADALAASLMDLGVRPADRVALVWPTSVAFVVGYLGALRAGAVVAPLNPQSPPAELERELAFIDPVAILCDEDRGTAPASVVLEPGGTVAGHAAAIDDRQGDGAVPERAGSGAVERAASDPAVLIFTSGTSGAPRAALLTHGNLIANLKQMLAVPVQGNLMGEGDVSLGAVPFFHIFGLNVVVGLTIATGAALVCEERFEPTEALHLVEERGVTVIAGAPPMFADWSELPARHRDSFSKVRLLLCGAAALDPDVSRRFTSRFGLQVWEGYGLTEASPAVSTSLGSAVCRPGSVGHPLPGVELRLVETSGEEALSGDPGEIWVRGPNVFGGYWRDPSSTSEVLDEQGWLHTGDMGVSDDEGELHIVDRLKDIIIVSGFNVVPAEVEHVVHAMAGVKDVAVSGRGDARSGEAVVAVVVPEGGAQLTESEVIAWCRAHLATYKVPTAVSFAESIPRGLVGKPIRQD